MTSREYAHRTFDTDIEVLRSMVTTMAGLVERQMVRAFDAIRRHVQSHASLSEPT